MKTGSKRGSGSGTGSGVLDAPETEYAPPTGRPGRGPAPAGSLQRSYSGYGGGGAAGAGAGLEDSDASAEETPRRARRGGWRIKLRWMPRSSGGRILLVLGLLTMLGGVAVTLASIRYFVLHDSRFVIATSADIQISGDGHLSRDQVLSVFRDDIARNVFRIPLAERRADVERLPWVAHATVMRLLPNHLRVLITERIPVAFVRQGSHIGLADASGVLLDMPREDAGDPNYSFPVLTGISAGDPLSTRAARMDIYRRFLNDLDSGSGSDGQKYTQTVSEVDVSNPEDVKALIASGGSDILVHFGDDDFLHRYQEFEEHLPEWKQQYPQLASADMRYEGQIVLEMQKGGESPMAGDSGSASVTGDGAAQKKAVAEPRPAERREGKALLLQNREKQIAKQAKMHAAAAAAARVVAAKKKAAAARAGGGTTP